ncbi:regulatory protein RecX [Aquirufa sp. ROCK-SH2]
MNSEFLNILARYCAYQERCVQELNQKMKSLGIEDHQYVNYLVWLEENNYLNEERFAEIYARSKFNQKKWGRNKIRFELKQRKIQPIFIQKALEQIDDEAYLSTLKEVINQKSKKLTSKDPWINQQKCYQFALSKGFESDLIGEVLKG